MNILFNKKILFSLLLSSSLLIQGAYAQNDDPSAEIIGTLEDPTGSSLSTPSLNIGSDGIVTVGDTSLSNGTGVIYIKDDTNNDAHTTASNIQRTLTINKDGNVLNEETMNCNSGSVVTNGGLFINQGSINVDNGATLICGKFPTTDTDWKVDNNAIENYKNYVGIMNGASPVDASKTPTFKYEYNTSTNTALISTQAKESGKYPGNSGTIIFIPGAICNDGSTDSGEIDGGYIDLTKYVYVKSSSINNTHTDNTDTLSLQFENEANNELSEGNPTNNNNTTKLQICLKDAEIKLFNGKIKNSAGTQVELDKDELSQLKLEDFGNSSGESNKSETTMKDMFKNLTFENCICEIPKDTGSGTANYKFTSEGSTHVTKTEEQAKSTGETGLQEKLITFNADATYRYKVGTDGLGGNSNNFDIVKKLFNSNGNEEIPIYHAFGARNSFTGYTNYSGGTVSSEPTDGLVLFGSGEGDVPGSNKTFSQLFNDYMDLNCYIATGSGETDTKPAYSEEKTDTTELPLALKSADRVSDKYSSNIFIQVSGNQPIKIDKQYIDGSNNDAKKDFPGTLELVFKNPWIHTNDGLPTYSGTLSRSLPTLDGTDDQQKAQRTTRIVQEYDGPAFDKYGQYLHNTGDGSKNSDTNGEILEYVVSGINTGDINKKFSTGHNISDTKPFTVDKFTIGDGTKTVKINSSEAGDSAISDILTQNLTVNSGNTYTLKGHITVRNLTLGDFKA